MANVTTTTAAAVIPEIWAAQIELAAQENRGFSGRIKEYQFGGPGDVLHIPKIGAIAAAAFSGTVSYTANTESTVDITPDVSYAAVQIDRKANVRALMDLGNVYQMQLGKGLAQYEDIAIASLYAGLSDSYGSGDFSEANYLLGIRKLLQNAKNKVIMGVTPIWGIFHPVQWDHVLVVGNINSAMVRGDSGAGPAKTGTIDMAYGVNIGFSGNVQVSTTARNMFFTEDAFAIARKYTPTVDQDFDVDTLSQKVVASQDFGVAELNDECGVVYATNAT